MTRFHTIWSEEDKEWVGLCDCYPSLSWLEPNREDALEGIKKLVEDIEVEIARQELEDANNP